MFNIDPHPFVAEHGAPTYQVLPPQIMPLKDKLPNEKGEPSKWAKATLDSLSTIARFQYYRKRKLLANYKLINGEFVSSEYYNIAGQSEQEVDEEQEAFDLINEVKKDLEVPDAFVRNYDIISQPVNTLVGELSDLPDLFMVEGKGERFQSDKLKLKSSLLQEWFYGEVESKIIEQLLKEGFNPDSEMDEEMQKQLQERHEQLKQQLTPADIQKYITDDFRHLIEQWAQVELEDQRVRFNLKKAQRVEFTDYLTIAERYRHIYLDGFGLKIESLNPLFVFSHKSPETEYVQDGNYAGIIRFLSLSDVINRYGYLMTVEQIESLQKSWKGYYKEQNKGKDMFGNKVDYLSPQGIPYQTFLPSLDRDFLQFAPSMAASGNSLIGILDEVTASQIDGLGENTFINSYGMLVVYECYWKTQVRLSKLRWTNPETQLDETIIVDENFIIPDWVQERKINILFKDEPELNTIVHTWVNQTWRGIKIDNYFTNGILQKPIYLDIAPNELQFKGELYIYDAKLPIAGQYANNRNTKPTSLVDRLKPYQFFYNVLMNQCFHYLQTEILPFVIMESNLIPKDKDWGGEDRLEKWLNIAQQLGATLADSSYQNTGGAPIQGGQLPREVNLDRSQRILTRLQMATTIRQLALEHIGIFPQRLGDVKSSETATGINQAVSRSYTQTSSWFESFFDCEREILQMQIDAAQTLQARNKDLGKTMIQSDFTQKLLEIDGGDFNLYQLHVYVLKSQEELRKLQTAQKLAEMNTAPTPMSDRILMATGNDIKEIVNTLKANEAKMDEQNQQQQGLEQQRLQQEGQMEQARLQQEEKQFYAKLQNELQQEYIRAFGNAQATTQDEDGNGIADMLELYKLQTQATAMGNQATDAQTKLSLENAKIQNEKQKTQMDFTDKDKQRQHEQILADKELKAATIRGDKSK